MDYRNHVQAFLNFSVTAKRKSGKNKEKPVFSRFKKFFDYEKREKEAVEGRKRKLEGLENILRKEGGIE